MSHSLVNSFQECNGDGVVDTLFQHLQRTDAPSSAGSYVEFSQFRQGSSCDMHGVRCGSSPMAAKEILA